MLKILNKGYEATMRSALDWHTITALAVPARGKDTNGATVPGYAFEVSHAGTLLISGRVRANKVYSRILQEAELTARVLPLTNLGH